MWKTLIPLLLFALITFCRGQTEAPDDASMAPPSMTTPPITHVMSTPSATSTPTPTNKVFTVNVPLTDVPYTASLKDSTTKDYQDLKDKLEGAMNTSLADSNTQASVTGFSPGSVIAHFVVISSSPTLKVDTVISATRTAMTSLNYTVGNITATVSTVTYAPLPTMVTDKTVPRTEVNFKVVFDETYLPAYDMTTSATYMAKVADLTKQIILAFQSSESVTTLKILALLITRLYRGSLGVEFVASFGRTASMSVADFVSLATRAFALAGLKVKSVAVTGLSELPITGAPSPITPGAIAFIVLACVFFVIFVTIGLVYGLRRKRRRGGVHWE